MEMSTYKKLIDPKEEQVNEILQQGYELHSVSVVKRGETHLWYHFIKPKQYYVNVDYANDSAVDCSPKPYGYSDSI
jgi:hypothetical protein